ncbi:MAG TPA: phenylacetic acid degradation bifunctional protein PaaZ [Bacteriovoracaceae bacterium]|nr:phenylacetic acid degradation bifunctional protein PaaZ [Bacteriovoracaceae bacterium]
MQQLENYALGKWTRGLKEGQLLHNAITGEAIAAASSEGLNFSDMMVYARQTAGPVLRKMTFHQRGRMLKALAMHLNAKKEDFYRLSWATGATRADSWIDIEGGIGNLFAYASLRRQFPDKPFTLDGDVARMSKGGSFIGHHICTPKEGVAIHINAFNFPIWGMLEKIAVNLLAGVPAIVKPATVTSFLAELVAKEIIASRILPEGSLQLICGSANGILESVTSHDVVTFTGSAHTGKMLKAHPRVIGESVPFNLEADSLNAMVLGPDVGPSSAEFDLFIKEATKEITIKAGQKCTAVRRLIVPRSSIEAVAAALSKRLAGVTIGNPQLEGVRMGALAGQSQVKEVQEKISLLSRSQKIIYGDLESFSVVGADKHKGAFMPPILFLNDDPFKNTDCHTVEAFGPVATLMPYDGIENAIRLARMGEGSLVCSIITADDEVAREFVLGSASMHGRILVLNSECAKESTGHGSPMPMLVHGGPGRAGGGEELGGKRGVMHYLQRTAIQGSPSTLTAITGQYQYGAKQKVSQVHPFRKYFEELQVGDTLITEKHTVTLEDIDNFADLSGDKFYAHMDANSLEGTIFTGRVAHGYFILSRAAGLFVDPPKGPVMLNYGLDECRFIKPVYPGATIGVRFTCKEKLDQEKKSPDDTGKGIVKWLVDVYDETGDSVAIATILTMVQKKDQT